MSFPARSHASFAVSPASSVTTADGARLSRGFGLSVLLHGVGAVLLFTGAWALREKTVREAPFILVPLVSPQTDAGRATAQRADGATPGTPDTGVHAHDFRAAMVRRQREEELRAEREIARMREQRSRDEALARADAGRAAPADREGSVSRVNDATAHRETSRTTSYGEFQRFHAKPHVEAEVRAGPRVDMSDVLRAGHGARADTTPAAGSSADANAMAAYFGDLISRLREAHGRSGVLALLSAEVEFTLTADGAISSTRIVRSSGDMHFDRSVLDAFARVRMPARPDGKSDTRRLTFRIRER